MTTPKLTIANVWSRQDVLQGMMSAGFAALAAKIDGLALAAPLPDKDTPSASLYGRNPDRQDGFNELWYLHHYADLAAEKARNPGFNPLRHWLESGYREGRLPFEGATPFDTSYLEPIEYGAPQLVMPDVYAPAGATEVRIQAQLVRGDKPCERSFSVVATARNGVPEPGGTYYGMFGDIIAGDTTPFLPPTGSAKEWTVAILQPTAAGFFYFDLHLSHDTPGIAGTCRVFLNTAPPEGYLYPDALPKVSSPKLPATAKAAPLFATNFLDDFKVSTGGREPGTWKVDRYAINDMIGEFVDPAVTRTKSGAIPDVYPVIDGVRTLRLIDCRNDLIMGLKPGNTIPWAAPSLVRAFGLTFGRFELETTMRLCKDVDAGIWGIAAGGSWPPESDHYESLPGHFECNSATFHVRLPDGRIVKQGLAPFANCNGRVRRTWEKTPDRYRQWLDNLDGNGPRLIVDCPNYHGDREMGLTLSLEGPGGHAAGGYDPAFDYSVAQMALHGLKIWRL